MPRPSDGRIPLFDHEGVLKDRITESRRMRLEGLGLIRTIRVRKTGNIDRCILFQRLTGDGAASAVGIGQYVGQKYSFNERLESGHTCWDFKYISPEIESALRSLVASVSAG